MQMIEIFPTMHLGLYKIRLRDPAFNSKTYIYSGPNILRRIVAIRMGLEKHKVVLEYAFLWALRLSTVNCHYTNAVYIYSRIHSCTTDVMWCLQACSAFDVVWQLGQALVSRRIIQTSMHWMNAELLIFFNFYVPTNALLYTIIY